jgi:RNA polymerase sigma-70 factor (ECF subfamily)
VVRCRARGQLRARLDSSDLVQETLLRAAQNIGQFEGAAEPEWRAWLGRIAEREVIHQLRHHLDAEKRAVSREQPLGPAGDSSVTGSRRLDQWLAKSQSSPSLVAIRKERAALLSSALGRLPDDYREVLILRNIEGLDFPEVARRMDRSAGAVRVLWVRALKKLREELAQFSQLDSRGPHA